MPPFTRFVSMLLGYFFFCFALIAFCLAFSVLLNFMLNCIEECLGEVEGYMVYVGTACTFVAMAIAKSTLSLIRGIIFE